MPGFHLNVAEKPTFNDIPKLKALHNKLLGDKPDTVIMKDIEYINNDRNIHVILPYRTHTNVRRGEIVNRFKHLIFFNNCREVFLNDRFYIFLLKWQSLFLTDSCISSLNNN